MSDVCVHLFEIIIIITQHDDRLTRTRHHRSSSSSSSSSFSFVRAGKVYADFSRSLVRQKKVRWILFFVCLKKGMVKGVVSFGLALALALAGLLAVPQVAALSENFDLYFLIDESGSIKNNDQNCKKLTGETCWQLFMDFAEDVINDVANLTEGFRENEDVEGLRTSLTFFDCNKGKPRWKEALPLTGNKSAISNVIQESKSIIPEGGTCPGEALNNIAENVEKNSIDNSGLSIPTAVIVLTDGLFEDGDAAKNAGDKIRASGAEVFALQVGELVKKQSGRELFLKHSKHKRHSKRSSSSQRRVVRTACSRLTRHLILKQSSISSLLCF